MAFEFLCRNSPVPHFSWGLSCTYQGTLTHARCHGIEYSGMLMVCVGESDTLWRRISSTRLPLRCIGYLSWDLLQQKTRLDVADPFRRARFVSSVRSRKRGGGGIARTTEEGGGGRDNETRPTPQPASRPAMLLLSYCPFIDSMTAENREQGLKRR